MCVRLSQYLGCFWFRFEIKDFQRAQKAQEMLLKAPDIWYFMMQQTNAHASIYLVDCVFPSGDHFLDCLICIPSVCVVCVLDCGPFFFYHFTLKALPICLISCSAAQHRETHTYTHSFLCVLKPDQQGWRWDVLLVLSLWGLDLLFRENKLL